MPHSLRAKLGGLRYKKIISDKDYDRLCKALDTEDVLNKIKAEILLRDKTVKDVRTDGHCFFTAEEIFGIIDKNIEERSE